jgi:hypothetical protein
LGKPHLMCPTAYGPYRPAKNTLQKMQMYIIITNHTEKHAQGHCSIPGTLF